MVLRSVSESYQLMVKPRSLEKIAIDEPICPLGVVDLGRLVEPPRTKNLALPLLHRKI